MSPLEINHMIGLVRNLRQFTGCAEVARRLEIQACVEMILMLPTKTGGPEDILLPGIEKNVCQAVLVGILKNRAGDPGHPWALK